MEQKVRLEYEPPSVEDLGSLEAITRAGVGVQEQDPAPGTDIKSF